MANKFAPVPGGNSPTGIDPSNGLAWGSPAWTAARQKSDAAAYASGPQYTGTVMGAGSYSPGQIHPALSGLSPIPSQGGAAPPTGGAPASPMSFYGSQIRPMGGISGGTLWHPPASSFSGGGYMPFFGSPPTTASPVAIPGTAAGGTAQLGGVPQQSLPSGPVQGYDPSAGGVPTVPSPTGTQAGAIAGNLGNFGGISQLGLQTGGLNAQLGALPYQANLPNYQGLLGQASGNALSNLQGILPADVRQQIAQAGAERGVATGSPNSPNANAAMLRALGLTSLGLQQAGQQQFGQLMGLTPTGPSFNPSSLFVSPEQFQAAQSAANLYASAPIPSYARNAAFGALNQGLNRGQAQTAPTQSQDLVGQIIGKYAPTATGGTPSWGGPNPPPGGTYDTRPGWDESDWGAITGGSAPDMTEQDWSYITGGSDPSISNEDWSYITGEP